MHVGSLACMSEAWHARQKLTKALTLSPQVPDRNASTDRHSSKRDAVHPQPVQRQPPAAAVSAAFAALDPDASAAAERTKVATESADAADVAAV